MPASYAMIPIVKNSQDNKGTNQWHKCYSSKEVILFECTKVLSLVGNAPILALEWVQIAYGCPIEQMVLDQHGWLD